MKIVLIVLLAALASLSGFVIHVITIEWLTEWISTHMQDIQIQPSWDVRYLAAVTSIEYGLAATGLYYLARDSFLRLGKLRSAMLFAVLMMALNGVFVRQPLMDFAIGNPIHVTLVQNIFLWLPWIIMAFMVVYGVEWIQKKLTRNTHATDF